MKTKNFTFFQALRQTLAEREGLSARCLKPCDFNGFEPADFHASTGKVPKMPSVFVGAKARIWKKHCETENAAFLPLLEQYSFDELKRRMRIINSTRQINQQIKSRLEREAATAV